MYMYVQSTSTRLLEKKVGKKRRIHEKGGYMKKGRWMKKVAHMRRGRWINNQWSTSKRKQSRPLHCHLSSGVQVYVDWLMEVIGLLGPEARWRKAATSEPAQSEAFLRHSYVPLNSQSPGRRALREIVRRRGPLRDIVRSLIHRPLPDFIS